MKRLLTAAAVYGALGLAGGLYYRTLTHSRQFTGETQLSVVHTHLLALGMLAFLSFTALEAVLPFLSSRAGRVFEIAWHVGMALTVGGMLVNGTGQVLGAALPEKALAGVSGLGHMVMTVAVAALFVALFSRVRARAAVTAPRPAA